MFSGEEKAPDTCGLQFFSFFHVRHTTTPEGNCPLCVFRVSEKDATYQIKHRKSPVEKGFNKKEDERSIGIAYEFL